MGLGDGESIGSGLLSACFLFALSIYLFYYLLMGAFIGVFLGGINGIGLRLITIIFEPFLITQPKYRFIAFVTVIVTTFIGSSLIFYLLGSLYSVTTNTPNAMLSLLTTMAAGYASQSVARGYLDRRERIDEETVSP